MMKRKLLSLLLSVLMVCSLLPGGALFAIMSYATATTTLPSGAIALVQQSASGSTNLYHDFKEMTSFPLGTKIAFLDKAYTGDKAVSMLGKGAILEVVEYAENGAQYYIGLKYGEDQISNIACYVKVIQKGAGFDSCQYGALYKVPNTSDPVQYRYFCWRGGAQNCGPLYSYEYEETTIRADMASCYLNDIAYLGSTNSADYTLTLKYTTNGSQTEYVTLDPGSYTVEKLSANEIKVTTLAETGSTITATYKIPDAIVYDKNDTQKDGCAYYPADMLGVQTAWAGENVILQTATREGYTLLYYQDASGQNYYPDNIVTMPSGGMRLTAIWKDTKAPDVTEIREVSLPTRPSEKGISLQNMVEDALTYTDNEPVSECSVILPTIPEDTQKRGCSNTYEVTVRDLAGNETTVDVKITFVPGDVEFKNLSFAKINDTSGTLTATLYEPGSDPIKESGFVWGIMQSPTVSMNNGKAKTATVVTEPDGIISVNATGLEKGVAYYTRAYVITENGVVYYSDNLLFGIDAPDYGVVTVSKVSTDGSYAVFTISRTGTEEDQTVYYRTLNGSAIAGTHFTHQADSILIPDGQSSVQVKVPISKVTTAYNSKAATSYSNVDREFSFEIYRVDGGAVLGDTTKATYVMAKDSDYQIPRTVYDTKTYATSSDVVNLKGSSDGDFVSIQTLKVADSGITYAGNANYKAYLSALGLHLSYAVSFDAKETYDCYSCFAIVKGSSIDNSSVDAESGKMTIKSYTGNLQYAVMFEHDRSDQNTNYSRYTFPVYSCAPDRDCHLTQEAYATGQSKDNGYIKFDLSQTAITLQGDATGGGSDQWNAKNVTHELWVPDTAEPQLIGVAPTADSTFLIGDTFTISLIFDEIVDATNTTVSVLNNMKVQTSWGEACYSGGAGSNVLYFTGKVVNTATGALKLLDNTTNDTQLAKLRDMCDTVGTKASSAAYGEGGSVDTRYPYFTLTDQGVSGGIGTVNILVNDEKEDTDEIRYIWTNSPSMPASGWLTMSAADLVTAKTSTGFDAKTRQELGSGVWYLHVLATCNKNKASNYQYATVNFGTPTTAAAIDKAPVPTLDVSVDNTEWAKSREISYALTNTASITSFSYRYEGDTSWTPLTVASASVTVVEEGNYIFRMVDKDGSVYTKTATVENLDFDKPEFETKEVETTATAKEDVYTSITVPLSFSDIGSGVKSYNYKFVDKNNPTMVLESASNLDPNHTSLTYTAGAQCAELTEVQLIITVYDHVGNSQTYTLPMVYQMINAQAALDNVPKLNLVYDEDTGIDTWYNDYPSIAWSLTDYEGKKFTLTLPDGSTITESAGVYSGVYLASANGTYTFTVVDDEYGGQDTKSVIYQYLDFTAPTLDSDNIPDEEKTGTYTVKMHFSDTQSGIKEIRYKVVTDNTTVPTEGLQTVSVKSDSYCLSIPITGQDIDTYYIYYAVEDNAGGDTAAGYRAGNTVTGFSKVLKVAAIHSHHWKYTLTDAGNTVTANCIGKGHCDYTATDTTLTLNAPAKTVYADQNSPNATLSATTFIGMTMDPSKLVYYKQDALDAPLASAPTTPGNYRVTFEVANSTDNGVTLYLDYTIDKATPQASDFIFQHTDALVYDGNLKSWSLNVKDGITGMGDITTYYMNNEAYHASDNAAVDVGHYTFSIDVANGAYYKAISGLTAADWKFTVSIATNVWTTVPSIDGWTYGDTPQEPVAGATFGTVRYEYYDAQNTLLSEKPTHAGSYTLKAIVDATANYTGLKQSVSFTVAPKEIKQDDFALQENSFVFDGSAHEPTVIILNSLFDKDDITVLYENNINAGENTAKVTVTGKSNAAGSIALYFTIEKRELQLAWTKPDILVYDGTQKVPMVKATNLCGEDAIDLNIALHSGDAVKVGSFDYEVTVFTYSKNSYGTTTNYKLPSDTVSAKYTVTPRQLQVDWVTPTNLQYDGTAKEPSVVVGNVANSDIGTIGVDIALSKNHDNINVGEFTYTMTGITGANAANYILPDEIVSSAYPITPRPLENSDFSFEADGHIYNGLEIIPQITSENGLVTANDYEVEYADNVNAGTASITVTGKNNACDQVVYYYTIAPVTLTESMFITEGSEFYYTSDPIEPMVTVEGAWINYLLRDLDYTVQYKSNVRIGEDTAKIILEGKNNATGRVEIPFSIVNPPLEIKWRLELFATTEGAFLDEAYYARHAKAGDVVTLKVSTTALGDFFGIDYHKIEVCYDVVGATQLGGNYDYCGHPVYKDGIATDFMLNEGFNKIVAKVYYSGSYVGEFDPFFILI